MLRLFQGGDLFKNIVVGGRCSRGPTASWVLRARSPTGKGTPRTARGPQEGRYSLKRAGVHWRSAAGSHESRRCWKCPGRHGVQRATPRAFPRLGGTWEVSSLPIGSRPLGAGRVFCFPGRDLPDPRQWRAHAGLRGSVRRAAERAAEEETLQLERCWQRQGCRQARVAAAEGEPRWRGPEVPPLTGTRLDGVSCVPADDCREAGPRNVHHGQGGDPIGPEEKAHRKWPASEADRQVGSASVNFLSLPAALAELEASLQPVEQRVLQMLRALRAEVLELERKALAALQAFDRQRGGSGAGISSERYGGGGEYSRLRTACGGSVEKAVMITISSKRKRKLRELNQGEIDFHEYHTKIRKIILEGTKPLIAEGLSLGFLDRSGIRKESSRLAPITDDSCLADLCEMARQFPLDSDSEPKAVQIIREEDMTSTDDLDLFSSVTRNSTNCARLVTLMGQKYLIPRHSSFLLSDISCIQPLLRGNNKFDVIIIDPPWENKSVKRSNRYQFLPAHQLKQIPVPSLAAPECLIVTWVTNRQKHLRFVKEELYPFWSIEAVTDWWWVKITKAGEFVFPLESSHKKPYENLVLGRYRKNKEYFTSETETTIYPIPDQKIICSIPSTLHSHKPSLSEMAGVTTKPGRPGGPEEDLRLPQTMWGRPPWLFWGPEGTELGSTTL
ncbi:METL4 protein, partial [Polypterus senegalus]